MMNSDFFKQMLNFFQILNSYSSQCYRTFVNHVSGIDKYMVNEQQQKTWKNTKKDVLINGDLINL